jgi:hypothetical protein
MKIVVSWASENAGLFCGGQREATCRFPDWRNFPITPTTRTGPHRIFGMFGQRLELIVMEYCVCNQMIALRVDHDDLDRHMKYGVFVQHAFVDCCGKRT